MVLVWTRTRPTLTSTCRRSQTCSETTVGARLLSFKLNLKTRGPGAISTNGHRITVDTRSTYVQDVCLVQRNERWFGSIWRSDEQNTNRKTLSVTQALSTLYCRVLAAQKMERHYLFSRESPAFLTPSWAIKVLLSLSESIYLEEN